MNTPQYGGNATAELGLEKPTSPVAFFCDAALNVENTRVACEVRLKHLANKGRTDEETTKLLKLVQPVEDFVDDRLRSWVDEHPTAPWWQGADPKHPQIPGAYRESMGKVIGLIEAFGKFYPAGDSMIPDYVKNDPEREPIEDTEGNLWIWVRGIERLQTPAALIKYAGFVPGMKREAGHLLDYNIRLKTMTHRLGKWLMMKKSRYLDEYYAYKERKTLEWAHQGIRVLPTPKGRFCPACQKDVVLKAAKFCPDCHAKLENKIEPSGIIWEGHLHNMAVRRICKLFLCHLWAVWREAEGLPLRDPYPVQYLGHTKIITSWDMLGSSIRAGEDNGRSGETKEE